MGLTIVTYGGGEILKSVFDAIAILMNNKSGELFRPLMVMSASIGAVWAITKALFSPSLESFLGRYFLPLVAITAIMMIPTTSVHIEDVLTNRSYKVDHVPAILARFSEFASSMGYRMTKAIEKVMHTPNDTNYQSTGMIFGSETSLDMAQYRMTNANLEQNLRRFSKQCVLYDIALEKYSVEDVKKTTDLWEFFKENTSKVRMMQYCPPDSSGDLRKCSHCSCQAAVEKMSPFFEKEKDYYAQHEVLKNLPLTFQALTGLQKDGEELIGQQLVMNTLSEEYGGEGFAKRRAQAQQRSTYRVMGSLAATTIVSMRSVIEALVYAAFIFIMPMTLLPGGIGFFSKWLGLVIWIQMWPPFFAILSYFMQTAAQSKVATMFYGMGHSEVGLSLFTSVGLQNLQEDVFALAGYFSASIPFISYAILRGGVGSFIHLASSMMTPAHTAASSAAAEQTTGNYSFGNASFGQTSYQNTSAFQKNLAPTLSHGYMTQNKGGMATTYTGEETILKQASSDLRTSFSGDKSEVHSLQQSHQEAQSMLYSSQQSHMDSVAAHSRNFVEASSHLAQAENYNENTTERLGYDVHESARHLQNIAEDWGKQYGFNRRESLEFLGSVGLGAGGSLFGAVGVEAGAKVPYSRNASKDEVLNSGLKAVESHEFQEHMQKVDDAMRSGAISWNTDEGKRVSDGYMSSFEQVETAQHVEQGAFNDLEQASQSLSWAENQSSQMRHNRNQEFVAFAAEKLSDCGGYSRLEEIVTNPACQKELEGLWQDFNTAHPYISAPASGLNLSEEREIVVPTMGASEKMSWLDERLDSKQEEFGLHPGMARSYGEGVEAHYQEMEGRIEKGLGEQQQAASLHQGNIEKEMQGEGERYLIGRVKDGPRSKEAPLVNSHRFLQRPFWLNNNKR